MVNFESYGKLKGEFFLATNQKNKKLKTKKKIKKKRYMWKKLIKLVYACQCN